MQNLLRLTKNQDVLNCIRQTAVGYGCCLTLRQAICGMSTGVQKAMFYQKFQIQLLKARDTNQGTLIELINYR